MKVYKKSGQAGLEEPSVLPDEKCFLDSIKSPVKQDTDEKALSEWSKRAGFSCFFEL